MDQIERVLVIGAGTMGAGIAEVCIKANIRTTLSDVSEAIVQKGVARIEGSLKKAVEKGKLEAAASAKAREQLFVATDRQDAGAADCVIEAVPEIMDLKKQLIQELAAVAKPE